MATKKKSAAPQATRTRKKKTVEAKHVVTFTAPTVVEDPTATHPDDEEEEEIEEEEEDDEALDLDDDEDDIKVVRQPSFAQQLRNKLARRGIGGSQQLKVRIDRLPSFDQDGMAGVKADKRFCGLITTTDAFFDNDEYLIKIQQSYGPGDYWITVRHKNSIVAQWQESVGGYSTPVTVGENGQVSPTIVYQQPYQPTTQPIAPADPFAQMRSAFKVVREFKADLGLETTPTAAPAAPASLDPEVLLLQNLASNDKFMDKITGGAIRKILGDKAVDDDPSPGAVAMEMVKTGQMDKAITAVGNVVLNVVDRIFSAWGFNNGSSPMASQTIQNQGQPDARQDISSPSVQGRQRIQPGEMGTNQNGGQLQGGTLDAGHTSAQHVTSQATTPQEQALFTLIQDCRDKLPAQIAYDKLMDLAEAVYEQAPAFSIFPYINYLGTMTTDAVLAFAETQPGGEGISKLEHAQTWTETLQELIRQSQPEEDGGEE